MWPVPTHRFLWTSKCSPIFSLGTKKKKKRWRTDEFLGYPTKSICHVISSSWRATCIISEYKSAGYTNQKYICWHYHLVNLSCYGKFTVIGKASCKLFPTRWSVSHLSWCYILGTNLSNQSLFLTPSVRLSSPHFHTFWELTQVTRYVW